MPNADGPNDHGEPDPTVRALLLGTPTMTGRDLSELLRKVTLAWLEEERAAGSVIAIPRGDDLLVPTFQFALPGLIPAAAEVNRILTSRLYPDVWARWVWWHRANPGLEGEGPVYVLPFAPERVIAAAREEADAVRPDSPPDTALPPSATELD